MAVLDSAFDVLVLEYGIEKRIHLDGLPLETSKFNEQKETLRLFWKKGVAVTELLADEKKDITDDYADDDEVGVDEEDILVEEMEVVDSQQPEPIEPATPAALNPEEILVSQLADSVKKLAIETSRYEPAIEVPEEPVVIRDEALEVEQETVISTTAQVYPVTAPAVIAPLDDDEPNAPNAQIIRVFSRLRVVINVDITKSPPIIKVLAANPFM